MGEADERKDEFIGALAALGGSAGNGRGDSMTLINRSSGVQAGAPSMPTSRRARTPREATTANSFDKAIRTIDDCLRKEAGCGTVLDYTEQTSRLLFVKYLDGWRTTSTTSSDPWHRCR